MYGLCDCNNFYASCERLFNPSLNGKPVVILSNNDGCIVARSNEAKALGIKMGVPLYQVKDIINKHKVHVYSSNYSLYGDISKRVMETLKSQLPTVEIYSIDEAFLDLRGFQTDRLNDLGKDLAKLVKRNVGIPVSIGIAPTKTLAKVASKLCKQYPKLEGCCFMHRPQDIEKVLKTFPIGDIWGVGRRYTKMLESYDIHTAQQFIQKPKEWVKEKMGITGLRTWMELQGEACITFEHQPPAKKQICISRSFAKNIDELHLLESAISTFTSLAAEKLRKQHSCCGEVIVFLFTNRHREDQPQQYANKLMRLPVASDNTIELASLAIKGLESLFQSGYSYKKAGIILSDLVARNEVQGSLFDPVDRKKQSKLMQTIDQINDKVGRYGVGLATQIDLTKQMNREHLSKRYTTDWGELLEIKL